MSRNVFEQVRHLIADAHERALRAGVSRATADEVLMRAEAAMVREIAEAARAQLDYLRSLPTAVIAERSGVTPRTVQRRREAYANATCFAATASHSGD